MLAIIYIYIYIYYIYIYNLNIKGQSEHVTFLDLDITMEDNVFIYKLFDKRDKFSFVIVGILFLSSNIPSSILCDSVFSEFRKIAGCELILTDSRSKPNQPCTKICVYMHVYV